MTATNQEIDDAVTDAIEVAFGDGTGIEEIECDLATAVVTMVRIAGYPEAADAMLERHVKAADSSCWKRDNMDTEHHRLAAELSGYRNCEDQGRACILLEPQQDRYERED